MVRPSPWRWHRVWQLAFWLLFLGFVPGAPLLAAWLTRRFNTEAVFLPVAIGWMAAMGIAGALWTSLRCPRCGERFFRRGRSYRNNFARECVNCGLPKGSAAE